MRVETISDYSCTEYFFFNDTATTEIYTLSLHDSLPILRSGARRVYGSPLCRPPSSSTKGRSIASTATTVDAMLVAMDRPFVRSEEHTSELQSRLHIVCRLLLEKKKNVTHYVRYMVQRTV